MVNSQPWIDKLIMGINRAIIGLQRQGTSCLIVTQSLLGKIKKINSRLFAEDVEPVTVFKIENRFSFNCVSSFIAQSC